MEAQVKTNNSQPYVPDPLIEQFIKALETEVPVLSKNTLNTYRSHLAGLDHRLQGLWDTSLVKVTPPDIERDIAARGATGTKANSLAGQFASYRRFYRYLAGKRIVGKNPMEKILRPKSSRYAAQRILEENEVDALLSIGAPSTPVEHRDRTILQVIYATGIRSSELIELTMDQVDLVRGTLAVTRKEKQKEKVQLLPLGEAKETLKNFVDRERDGILLEKKSAYVFPSIRGDRMTRQALWYLLRKYGEKAGSSQALSQQVLRRMFLLRKNGHPPEQQKLALGNATA